MVYLKYWILKLRPLMVYPEVLFPSNFIIKGLYSKGNRAANLLDLVA